MLTVFLNTIFLKAYRPSSFSDEKLKIVTFPKSHNYYMAYWSPQANFAVMNNPLISVALNGKGLFLICVLADLGFVGALGGLCSMLPSPGKTCWGKCHHLECCWLLGPGKERQRILHKLLKYSTRKQHIIFHSRVFNQNKSYGHAYPQDNGDMEASPVSWSGQEPDIGE